MRSPHGVLARTLLAAAPGTPFAGSWVPARIFRRVSADAPDPLTLLGVVTPR
ncbi:MAG TPA: hypothetical protein VM736_12830 [Gemmatimonadales bacterium]|nr:hypothetical protein [Gemmatimonadales bacterium]